MKTGKVIGLMFLELVLMGSLFFAIGFFSGKDYEHNNPRVEVVE